MYDSHVLAYRAKTLCDNLESWGACDLMTKYFHAELWQKLESMFMPLREYQTPEDKYSESRSISFYRVLDRFNPAPAEKDSRLLAIYKSKEHKDSDRRTIGKPGKMVKHILPFLTESECESFANWYRDNIKDESNQLTIAIGESRDDFKRVYTAECIPGDPRCTSTRKSLQASCMRHAFDNLRAHPVEAYASGDFKIVYVQDRKGLIGARVIIRPDNKSHAPIYVSTNPAGDMLESWLKDNQYEERVGGFFGASLLRIDNGDSSQFIAPYMDICADAELNDDRIELTKYGNLTLRNTQGYYESNEYDCTCDDCGEGMREDDSTYIESSESCICESCRDDNYFRCEGDGNWYHNDSCVEVWRLARGREVSDSYSQSYVENYDFAYCESRGEYWQIDDTIYSESQNEYYPTCDINRVIFESDFDSEYYLIDEKIKLSNGQYWTKQQVIDSGQFDIEKILIKENSHITRDGTEIDCSEYELVAILRNPFEYDESGNIICRQLEMPLAA